MEDVGAPSTSRQAGKTARGRSDCHFRHPACVETRMPLARRPASLWATDDHLQPLQSLVPAPYLAAHFRENGGRRCSSGDELSIDSSHVKAHRSAAGSKRGSSRKRLAVRAAEERAKSMLWPMIAADRSPLR